MVSDPEPSLDRYRSGFAEVLRSPYGHGVANGLWTGLTPGQALQAEARFRIYRNNVFRSLLDALAAAYPVVARLVGTEFFTAMARAYLAGEESRPPSLALYGAAFPDFIAGFAPAASLPYLPTVARLERAWLEALHAVDAGALDPAGVEQAGAAVLHSRFRLHPATRWFQSAFAVVTLWRSQRPGAGPGPVGIPDRAELAVVTRPQLGVRVLGFSGIDAQVVRSLLQGDSLGEILVATPVPNRGPGPSAATVGDGPDDTGGGAANAAVTPEPAAAVRCLAELVAAGAFSAFQSHAGDEC